VGRPNVGKSSLLNRLLRTERAIVTPIPGTTRDTLEETIALEGIPFVLVDTAGIGETVDTIERLSIERSRASLQRADLALVVVDGSQSPTEADHQVGELAAARPAIVVVNKSDLPSASDYAALLPAAPHIAVSALAGAGIPDLEALLVETVFSGHITLSDEPLVSNPRHRDLLRRAREQVVVARGACLRPNQGPAPDRDRGVPSDLVAIDVTEAVNALGEITGETASEDLLERIFANFCIGK